MRASSRTGSGSCGTYAGQRGSRGQRLRRARRRDELERAALTDGPEKRGLGSGCQRGDADHLFGAARLVEPGGERVSRERKAVGGDRARSEPVARAECTQNQPEVGRCESSGRDLRRLEPTRPAVRLEAAERTIPPAGREQQHTPRVNQSPCSADRFGKTLGRGLVPGYLGERETRAGELGGERLGAADHSAHAEHPVLVGDPDRDRVRSDHLGNGPPEAVERLLEPTLVSRAPPRSGERLEPLLGDAVHKPHGKVSPTGIAR